MMLKACSRCGKIHPYNEQCNVGKVYRGGEERKLRAKAAWHNKSLQIRERAQYLCEVCRDQGIYNYKNLEVHHIIPVRVSPDLLLDDLNLICLCDMHHKMAEKGELSIEYLQKLAEKRER